MRWIKGVLKIKDWQKKERARELEQLRARTQALKEEIASLEERMAELERTIKQAFSFEKLIEYKSLLSKKSELEKALGELENETEKKKDELKLIYKDIKAVEVVKGRLETEMRRKEFSIEMQRANFLHLIIKKFLVFLLIFPLISFDQSALQKKIKARKEAKVESELKAVSKELEEKLKKLEEERKKLEELKRVEPKKEEVSPDFQKLIAIFNKADPDEAGAIMNNMDPNLAAEILLNLKPTQSAAILSAMDSQKAAQVSEIMARKRNQLKKAP
ncbi:magnesium transporter MgtE N-terminal domain-containing protein [Thermocrinis sp.]|jgi:flagellar motility protein MotE (MotC chaperone)|uniref:MotE family protein n=1 Tax=Thermocrinis sp. TaxID=2024383 RepID=UPI003C1170AF